MKKIITAVSFLLIATSALPVKRAPEEIASVKIGAQTWSVKNLDVLHFRNGDPIFEANSAEAWEKANIEGKPAWCYYNNDPEEGKVYGKLYNFWAVSDKRGLAPEGWHIPGDAEWDELAAFLKTNRPGGLKAGGNWKDGKGGSAKGGFAALPGGYRSHELPRYYGGPFFKKGVAGYWWSSTRYLVDNSFCRVLSYDDTEFKKDSFVQMAGLAVRLVKDTPGKRP